MVRSVRGWLAGLIAVIIVSTSASGQGMPQGPIAMPGAPGGQNPILILLSPAVQKELKLDDQQKERTFQVAQTSSVRSREITQSIQAPTTTPQQYFQAISSMRQENEKALSKLLDAKQKERLQQIVLQIEGPMAVSRPEIASKVGLTQAQKQKVQGVMEQFQMAQRQIVFAARQRGMLDNASREAARGQAANLRKAANLELGKVLNRKQKDAFNSLLGEGFDLSRIDPDLASPPTQAAKTDDSGDESPRPARKKSGR